MCWSDFGIHQLLPVTRRKGREQRTSLSSSEKNVLGWFVNSHLCERSLLAEEVCVIVEIQKHSAKRTRMAESLGLKSTPARPTDWTGAKAKTKSVWISEGCWQRTAFRVCVVRILLGETEMVSGP